MKLDQTKLYQMPFIMGPQYNKDPLPGLSYPQTENVVIQYQTNYEAARNLVPECYTLDEKPTVTVVFGYHNGLEFLAGNGYSLATFQISAKFKGEENQIKGDYIPIMFENQTLPILGGRDYLGVPKLFADISPIKSYGQWQHPLRSVIMGTFPVWHRTTTIKETKQCCEGRGQQTNQ